MNHELIIQREIALAKVFNEPRPFKIKGIELVARPTSRVGSLLDTYRYFVNREIRRKMEGLRL